MRQIKYSIIIPTWNHFHDCLLPAYKSIIENTDLSDVEIIFSCNGCVDETIPFLQSEALKYPDNIVIIESKEQLGYIKPVNLGLQRARGEYVILFNNDVVLLPQEKNLWLYLLEHPFMLDDKIAISGPLHLLDPYVQEYVIIFFLAMMKRSFINDIGLLPIDYGMGGHEDIYVSMEAKKRGYKTMIVPIGQDIIFNGQTNISNYPAWHKNNKSFSEIPEYSKTIIKENGFKNLKKYNKNIKLNLGSGGVDYPGYISVDLYDERALVNRDIRNLYFEFADSSVESIIAYHVIEHISPWEVPEMVAGWYKMLKPGGSLFIEVPDIDAICKEYTNSNDKMYKLQLLNCIYCPLNTTGVGKDSDVTSYHKWAYGPQSMWELLMSLGFKSVQIVAPHTQHPGWNLRAEAIK